MAARFLVMGFAIAAGCSGSDARRDPPAPRPDEPPVLIKSAPPFHYPASLYARRLQGNVVLRIVVDVNGAVVPESTSVYEGSGYAAFDSAALSGSRQLRFVPAKLHGEPLAIPILFPVYFRHPEAPPLAADSLLSRGR